MKVKVTKSKYANGAVVMWYHDKIGDEFEVTEDPYYKSMYLTETKLRGKLQQCHIYKEDCEIVAHG